MGREIKFKKFKKYKLTLPLFSIFLIGFAMRYITKHELLFDPDSYWWYQLAMYFSGIRTEHFIKQGGKTIYELAYYPTGRVLEKELLLLPMTIGYTFKLFSFAFPSTPEGMLSYMFIFGPFFGALTCVVAYFLAFELTKSEKASFIAALFYSFAPFAMTRNTAGDTGQESLGTFLLFLFLYFFIKSSKQEDLRRNVGYAALAGVLFILAANTWGGTSFYWGLVLSSAFVYLVISILLNKETRPLCIALIIFLIIGVLFPTITGIGFKHPLRHAALRYFSYIVLVFSIVTLGIDHLEKTIDIQIDPRIFVGGSFILILFLIYVTSHFYLVNRIINFINHLVFAPEEKGLTGKTIAYYRTTTFDDFKQTFRILLVFIPVGSIYLLYSFYKRKKYEDIFMLFFMLLGIVAFRWMIRLSFFLAFIIPLFVGIIFYETFRKASESKTVKANIVFTVIFLLLIVAQVCAQGINNNYAEKNADWNVRPWKDAGEWVKEHTPENTLLIHWWDYGYHLQTFAQRYTIVDGGNSGKPLTKYGNRNIDVAKAFCSNESSFYNYIRPYNPDNMSIYVLVSYEEFGKSGAINFHAGDELFIASFTVPKSGSLDEDNRRIAEIFKRNKITTYYILSLRNKYLIWALIQVDNEGKYHPEWSEKVLAKLLPFNTGLAKGMKHFELVYQNGYVYVYRYTM